ncbi:hypothetical protein VDR99_06215, partial [Xanthomonas campestris pv. campestris]|nr:hypothetical protein [Xanthomonas campestris pv. campestris]
ASPAEIFVRDIHVPYKNVAHPCAPPCGLYLSALPLRYGAPEKLQARAKAKRQAASGKRSRWLSNTALTCGKLIQLAQCYRAQRAPTPTTR